MIIIFCFFNLLESAKAQQLDETWTVTVAGQTTQVNADGTFTIPNVSSLDRFGAGGPGTPSDGVSDRFVRLTGQSTSGGVVRYVFSDPFQFSAGVPYTLTDLDLTVTFSPPPLAESIRAVASVNALTALGEQTQMQVTAFMPDGSTQDITPREKWTVYRTSNPDIATINKDGLVTAVSRGMVFITAINEGTASVAQIDISPGDPLTTLAGVILFPDGTPVEGALVRVIGANGFAITDANGAYRIDGVATSFGISGVTAQITTDEGSFFSSKNDLEIEGGGFTDAGIMEVDSLCNLIGGDCIDSDGDCLPDSLEIMLSLNPNVKDSNNNGIDDGEEDPDLDRLTHCVEAFLGTNGLLADTDGDNLNDDVEYFLFNSDPVLADTDGEGLNDGDEFQVGSNPRVRDTDDDGYNDADEFLVGSDPNNPLIDPTYLTIGINMIAMPATAMQSAYGNPHSALTTAYGNPLNVMNTPTVLNNSAGGVFSRRIVINIEP